VNCYSNTPSSHSFPGQERFGNMTRAYYTDAVAAFIIFDATRISTLEGAHKWKVDLDSKVAFPVSNRPIPTILVASKVWTIFF
jgi:GTPase SAR1 family protein